MSEICLTNYIFAFIPSNGLHLIIALLDQGVANDGGIIRGEICKALRDNWYI